MHLHTHDTTNLSQNPLMLHMVHSFPSMLQASQAALLSFPREWQHSDLILMAHISEEK
jgi:hypothetical protein